MPVPTFIHPSYLTWLGLSHESVYGTPALSAALGPVSVLPLDASSFSPEDKPMWLRDIAIRGSQADVYAIIQGVEDSAWSLGGPAYVGITPILLDNTFGDITTTATGGTPGTATTTNLAYTRNSSGTSLGATSIAGFTVAGQTWKIVSSGSPAYTEYFTVQAAAGSTITMLNPLHYNYPSGSALTPYTANPTYMAHKFAVLNAYDGQPPTYTLVDSTNVVDTLNAGATYLDADAYGQRYYTSVCMAQLDFTISAEALFTQKASGTGWRSRPTASNLGGTAAVATAPYAVPALASGTLPIPSWSSNIQLSLSDISSGTLQPVTYVGEVTFSIKRKIQVYWTDDGSQDPYIIARGPLGVTGTVKGVVAQDEQMLQNMLKNFQGALQATILFPAGSGPAFVGTTLQTNNAISPFTGAAFQFNVAQAAFTAAKPTRSSVLVGYDSTFEGVANATNVGQSGGLGPITVTAVDLNAGY